MIYPCAFRCVYVHEKMIINYCIGCGCRYELRRSFNTSSTRSQNDTTLWRLRYDITKYSICFTCPIVPFRLFFPFLVGVFLSKDGHPLVSTVNSTIHSLSNESMEFGALNLTSREIVLREDSPFAVTRTCEYLVHFCNL